MLTAPPGTYCREFRDGLAMTMPLPDRIPLDHLDRRPTIGFIDKSGDYAIKPQFDAAWDFEDGCAAVLLDKKFGFIDKTGQFIIEPQYESASYFSEGFAAVKVGEKTVSINKQGQRAIDAEYEEAHGFMEGLSAVKREGKWGFIDKTGAIVVEPRFDKVSSFFNGMASIVVNKKYGYIDKSGKVVVEPLYDYGHFFLGELAGVTFHPNEGDGAGTGYIDREGQVVWAPKPKVIQQGQLVYANDFEASVDDEWSKTITSVTPTDARRFLGQFGPEQVTLSLADLPKHQFVRVSFDLFLIQSWDGSSPNWGPDIWELSVEDGPRLIHATFTNCGFFSDNNVQSFPDDHPSTTHKGWTGASEKQSLGYKWFNDRNSGKGFVTDGVYRMNVIFPHAADSMQLNFRSHCKDAKEDQSWGLDNVKIETVTSAVRLSVDDMNQCWTALAGDDPVLAFESIWQLISAGEQAIGFLYNKLHVDATKASDEITRLLADLADDNFETREIATGRLSKFGRGIEPILRNHLEATKSVEAQLRIKMILKSLEAKIDTPAEKIRRQRAARVLEFIDTEQARELRKLIATPET